MPALSAYSNTENTALSILFHKGYRVWLDSEEEAYYCEKDGWDFRAESKTELLGVVAIYEFHGCPKEFKEYWWKIDEPNIRERMCKEKPNFVPIYKQKKK